MATTPFVKFDDGSEGFAANCFPVRGLAQEGSDGMQFSFYIS